MNWMTPRTADSICPPIPELYVRVLHELAALGFASDEPHEKASHALAPA
jgi:hypothetical protein